MQNFKLTKKKTTKKPKSKRNRKWKKSKNDCNRTL